MTYDPAASTNASTSAPATANQSNIFSILAFVFGGIAVLFLPIVLGPVGIVLAVVAIVRKERLGKIALGVAIAGTIIGMVLGAVVFSAMQA
ncbi:hypothetical protein J4G33_12680 [Actinotalea sp. BY-33]|uniref:DUF4190 domain-containing protein n=1 Tax=Actinotalea soli TaxID=2819234 RepID=A0A939LQK7_9CELL|nr:hypothetical protein [Actinotalea soli]MBO1752661.1 hypothetical protein [Actinotalea soli]